MIINKKEFVCLSRLVYVLVVRLFEPVRRRLSSHVDPVPGASIQKARVLFSTDQGHTPTRLCPLPD